MDEDSLSGLVVIAVLITLNGVLTLMYAALLNVRMGSIRELAEDNDARAKEIFRLNASTRLTVTFQTLTTLIYFVVAAVTLLNVANPIINNTEVADTIIYVTSLLISAGFTLVLGNIVPEAIGSSYANAIALTTAPIIRMILTVLWPLVFVMLRISLLLSALFGSSKLVNTVTEEEIMTLVDAGYSGGTIEDEEKEMIFSVLQLDQTRVSEVMIPRIDVVAIDIENSLDDAGRIFVESGFSRIPVYEESIDQVRGLLYAKDLLAHWHHDNDTTLTVAKLMRPVHFVPETKLLDEMLKEIQEQNVHLAIVVDEYGGTAGLVTIEDVIEEIIGDIRDEYDLNEEEDYEQLGPDEYTVDASIDLDDLNELLDVDLPAEDVDTLGGYIYDHFGRVPTVGDTIDDQYLTMHVMSVEGRRIRKVHIVRKQPPTTDDDPTDAAAEEMGRAG